MGRVGEWVEKGVKDRQRDRNRDRRRERKRERENTRALGYRSEPGPLWD